MFDMFYGDDHAASEVTSSHEAKEQLAYNNNFDVERFPRIHLRWQTSLRRTATAGHTQHDYIALRKMSLAKIAGCLM